MHCNRNALIFILLNIAVTTSVWANGEKPNDCERLHVQIGNATQSACKLVKSKVVHGTLIVSPPAVIMSGFTERFDIKQTLRGPDIVLEYNCNGQHITFHSQQNYCFLKAGQISGSVTSADANMHATFHVETGSYYWGQPGSISWVLSN